MKKRLLYLHMEIGNVSLGVGKKVQDQVKGLEARYTCEYLKIEERGVISLIQKMYQTVLQRESEILYIRNKLFLNLFLIPLLIKKRWSNNFLILEIPTPLATLEQEIKQSNHSFLKRLLSLWLLRLAMPLTLPLFHLVVTVLPEKGCYERYIQKQLQIGNGVDTQRIPVLPSSKNSDELHLLGIGHVSHWHGYDRLLYGLYKYFKTSGEYKKAVFLNIVGEGPARRSLEKLVGELNIGHCINFIGNVYGNELNQIYQVTDLCVGNLAAYRIGLDTVAALKHREFCAYGLPFITSTADPDFPEKDTKFVFYQEADDRPIDVDRLVQQLTNLQEQYPNYRRTIRKYAENRLDWCVKFRPLFEQIEKYNNETN